MYIYNIHMASMYVGLYMKTKYTVQYVGSKENS